MIEDLILDDGFGLNGMCYIIEYEKLDNDEDRLKFLNDLRLKNERAFKLWFELLKHKGAPIPTDFIP